MNTLETLQRQRDTFAELVTLLAAPEHAYSRTWAVDRLELTHWVIQGATLAQEGRKPLSAYWIVLLDMAMRGNVKAIEKLSAALIRLSDTKWTASEGAT